MANARFIVLPELQEIADDWGDLFAPESCKPDMATVRRGRIKKRDGSVCEIALAYVPQCGSWGIHSVTRDSGGKWELSSGGSNPDPRIVEALTHVIGCCPT